MEGRAGVAWALVCVRWYPDGCVALAKPVAKYVGIFIRQGRGLVLGKPVLSLVVKERGRETGKGMERGTRALRCSPLGSH